ncbi:MAG: hypothetical protein PVF26_03185 [Desulfobacterales bacterium]
MDFTAIGGKRQEREVPQLLQLEPGAPHAIGIHATTRFGKPNQARNYPKSINLEFAGHKDLE